MDETYTKLCEIFPVLEGTTLVAAPHQDLQSINYDFIISELKALDIADVIVDQVRLSCEQLLRHQIVPRFWATFGMEETTDDRNFLQFESAVLELYQQYVGFVKIMRRLEAFKGAAGVTQGLQDEKSGFDIGFKCALLSQLPVGFERLVDAFYGKSFYAFAGTGEGKKLKFFDRVFLCFVFVCRS